MTRKKQILQTAAQLFKDRGYSAVTMRDIAAVLDLKAASLYNHISGKQELLTTIILEVANEFTKGMMVVINSDQPAYNKVEQLILLHINIALDYTNALAVLNTEWMHLEGKSYDHYIDMRKCYEHDFKSVLTSGINDATFKNMSIDTMLFNLLSTLRSIYLWIPKKSGDQIQALKKELPQMLLTGVTV